MPAPHGPTGSFAARGPLVGAFLLFAALATLGALGDDPLTTDSMAYIEVARNVADGRGVVTHVLPLGFHGTGLAPFANQAPGFPLLLAPLLRAGIDGRSAAVFVSGATGLAAFALFVLLVRHAAPRLAVPLAFLYALGQPFAETANHALSEPAFLATLFAALLVGSGDRDAPFPGAPPRAFATGLLSGFLLTLRYAGLPAAALLGAIASAPALSRGERGRTGRRALLSWAAGTLVAMAPVLVTASAGMGVSDRPPARQGFARNLLWSAGHAGKDTVFTLPWIPPSEWIHGPIGAAALVAGTLALARRARRPRGAPRDEHRARLDPVLLFASLFPIAHVAWLSAVRSVVHFNSWATRHLVPAYPFLLLGIAAALLPALEGGREGPPHAAPPRRRRAAGALAAALVALYALGNLARVAEDVRDPKPGLDLGEVSRWLAAHALPDEAILATEPEALAHALPGRRVIALVRWPYRVRVLERSDLPRLRAEHGARWLVLLSARANEIAAGAYGSYARSLVDRRGEPDFTLAAEVPGGLIFRLDEVP